MRYAWDQFDAYFGPDRVGEPVSRLMRPIMAAMARWDRATEGRVHRYLAISQYVARRISLYYNRESSIVYPPVETTFYTPGAAPAVSAGHAGVLVVSALVPYKRVDLAIRAAHLAGLPLTVVGDGPERASLEAMGGDGVRFLGWCTNEEIRDLYRASLATILPGEEDFGIVPLEAQACGRPVVALGRGGALETVVDGETGVLVEPGEQALADGLQRAASMRWDPSHIRHHAEAFSRARFVREIQAVIDDTDVGAGGSAMVKRHNRLLVAFHVLTDAVLGMVAFVAAYFSRFETGLIPTPKGQPPFDQYIDILPYIAIIVPIAFHVQGLYRLRRGRSRIDDFFNVLVGSVLAVVFGIVVTLYVGTYYVSDEARDAGAYEVSRAVWAIFLVFNIALGYTSRKLVREALERRWIAGSDCVGS
jgi:hypothetical protein